jgi:hypothetical protein
MFRYDLGLLQQRQLLLGLIGQFIATIFPFRQYAIATETCLAWFHGSNRSILGDNRTEACISLRPLDDLLAAL